MMAEPSHTGHTYVNMQLNSATRCWKDRSSVRLIVFNYQPSQPLQAWLVQNSASAMYSAIL